MVIQVITVLMVRVVLMVIQKLMTNSRAEFEHITLYTYNGAAIFSYIWSTTVLHN